MKKSIIFFISFAVVFISLYLLVKARKVSLDVYNTICIKYLPNDTMDNGLENIYVFNLNDSLVNVFSEDLGNVDLEKFKFYDKDFYQYIIKGVYKSKEIDISILDSTIFNITTVDTLGHKQFYFLKQENVNQLIDNYFPNLK